MSPRRRSVLCTLGVGLTAGCLRAANDASQETGTKTSPEGTPGESTPTDAGEQTATEPAETEPLDASATQLWEVPYGVDPTYRLARKQHVHVDDGLLVGTLADAFALLADDGTVRWTQSAGEGGDDIATFPIDTGDIVLYAGRQTLFGLDATTGDVRWQTPLPIETDAPTFVETAGVFGSDIAVMGITYGTDDDERGTLAGVEPETGDVLWQKPHDKIADVWENPWLGIRSLSPPIAGRTIVGGWNNAFWVDIETGTIGESAFASANYQPVVANGILYLTDASMLRAYSVSGESVSEKWTFEPLTSTRSAPTVANGTVYVTADGTGVYAVKEGKRVWRYQADSPISPTPAVTADTVWAGENKLHMVDRASGAGRVVAEEREPQALSADSEVVFVSTETATAAYRRQP